MTAKLVRVVASTSEVGFAADFRDLLRSVGCDIREDAGPADAAIVIAGGGDAPAIDGAVSSVVVVMRPGASAPASVPRARRVDGSGSVYDVLERVATPLGLEIRTDVFLSYARRDAAVADTLMAALVERGRRPWVDRRDLEPSDKWLDALRRGIEASDTFLFLATSTSVRSKWCGDELSWADESGKRILPVLVHPVTVEELPEKARERQHIEIAAGQSVEQHADAIVEALERDPKIVRMHRQLLLAALEWKRDPAQVLRGGELTAAEEWLGAAAAVRDLRPTELHTRFIAASRAAQRKRQRIGVAVATLLFCIIGGLAVWALFNAREARDRAAEAQSRLAEQNAFGSYVDWPSDPSRAFLLADAALRAAPERDPLRIAYDAMARNLAQQVPACVTNLETGAVIAAIAPKLDRVFVRASGGKRSFVIPLTGRGGRKIELADPEPFLRYSHVRFSRDGALVAAIVKPFFGGEAVPYRLVVWRSTGERLGSIELEPLTGDRAPEVVGFSGDARRILLQSGGEKGVYAAYAVDIEHLDAPIGKPLYSAPSLLLLGQVDVQSSTAVAARGNEVRLLDAFTGQVRSELLRLDEPVRQVVLGRGGGSIAVVTGSRLTAWRLEGRVLREAGSTFQAQGVYLWDVTADGSMVVLFNAAASYPAERWSFTDGTRVSIPVRDRIKTPFIMHAGEEYRPLSFVGDRWLLAREPLRDPLEGGSVQQLLLFDRHTLDLAASPFLLPTGYLALLPAREDTRFAVVTRDGWVEEWDLLRRALPRPRLLRAEGLLLDAQFTADGTKILTRSRVQIGSRYASRLDFWDSATAAHAGSVGGLFAVRTEWCRSADGRRMATASRAENGYTIALWDLRTFRQLWTRHHSAPVESIAFRAGDTRVVTAGIDDDELRRIRVVEYDVVNARTTYDGVPQLDPAPVHVALSVDGETLIADYEYNSIAFWQMAPRARLDRGYRFNDASGMRFDLGYDIVRNLHAIRTSGENALTGVLPGGVTVIVRPEGEGTTILPMGSDTPVLSAFARGEENLYPVRGADLLSPSGRWFTLGTNVTSVDRASGLRVYDLVSGFPITELLLHSAAARPGEPWPRILSTSGGELDPVLAVMFLEDAGVLVTVTTNGVVRRWPVLRPPREAPFWSLPSDLAAAMTGRRFISARALQRVPQQEYARLRERMAHEIAAARGTTAPFR